jgi:hypothetical protein
VAAGQEPAGGPGDGDGAGDGTGDGPEAWECFADAVLARAAVRFRRARGVPPDPVAGLVIRDESVDQLLDELPGVAGAGDADDPSDDVLAGTVAGWADRLRSRSSWSRFGAVADAALLGDDEAQVLALAAATELDVRRQRLLAYVQDDVTKVRLTLDGLTRVLPSGRQAALALGPDSRLRRAALVDLAGDGPWASRTVTIDPAVLWALLGDGSPDSRLPVDAHVVAGPGADAAGGSLTVVTGPDRVRRLQVATSRTAARAFLVTPQPPDRAGWETVVREATLGNLGVVVELDGDLSDEGRRWVERADHLAWSLVSRDELPIDRLPRRPWTEHRSADGLASVEEWREALGDDRIEPTYPLTVEQLRRVARVRPAVDGDLPAAVRRLASGPLERLAVRVRPSRTWDDVVLPPDHLAQLRELTARYEQRTTVYDEWGFHGSPSQGLVALFAGPSGTGKTLSAEIIAGHLGLDLYKIELSSVLSKWIGETEKNLEQVFEAAEGADVLLLFDEADALFGKRSEVSDAKDRYANVETAYLLQRIERHDGAIVLTTNLAQNLDPAFTRRIHVTVGFALPDEAERRRIWQLAFGPKAPVEGVDVDDLARRFGLSGGSIHNVALTAGFLAADAGTAITMQAVAHALHREYAKLGRLVTREEFGDWYEHGAPSPA